MKLAWLRRHAIGFPLAVSVVIELIFISEAKFERLISAVAEIEMAQVTKSYIHTSMQQMPDAETGQRDFLLTGNLKHLQPYGTARANVNQTFDSLHGLFGSHFEDMRKLAGLSRQISRKLAEPDLSVRMRQSRQDES